MKDGIAKPARLASFLGGQQPTNAALDEHYEWQVLQALTTLGTAPMPAARYCHATGGPASTPGYRSGRHAAGERP